MLEHPSGVLTVRGCPGHLQSPNRPEVTAVVEATQPMDAWMVPQLKGTWSVSSHTLAEHGRARSATAFPHIVTCSSSSSEISMARWQKGRSHTATATPNREGAKKTTVPQRTLPMRGRSTVAQQPPPMAKYNDKQGKEKRGGHVQGSKKKNNKTHDLCDHS